MNTSRMTGSSDDKWNSNYAKLLALNEKYGQAVCFHTGPRCEEDHKLRKWLIVQRVTLNPDIASDKAKLDKLANLLRRRPRRR